MRILHLCLGCFYVDNHSYQENMLPKYHQRLGHEVYIIASTLSFDSNGNACNVAPGAYENEYGIPVRRLAYRRHLPASVGKFLRLYEPFMDAVEEIRPDVIFIHGCQFLDIYKLLPYLRKNKVTVFVDNHADFSNSATNFLSKNILHKFLWRRCAQAIEPYTRMFYGVLPARVDFLKDIYRLPAEKVRLLVMGVDDEMAESLAGCRESFRARNGIQDETGCVRVLLLRSLRQDRRVQDAGDHAPEAAARAGGPGRQGAGFRVHRPGDEGPSPVPLRWRADQVPGLAGPFPYL